MGESPIDFDKIQLPEIGNDNFYKYNEMKFCVSVNEKGCKGYDLQNLPELKGKMQIIFAFEDYFIRTFKLRAGRNHNINFDQYFILLN